MFVRGLMEQSKPVGIWIRVSTEDQVKGESPEHHERRARTYAESKDWNVRELYRLDAMSGKSVMDYPETKRMLSDVRSGKITGLVFSKPARLARNTRELLEFAEIFRECNAELISLQESIDTSTPAGRLFYTMIAAMAQWEREEIADRVAASVPIRAKLGKSLGGQAPFGYRWIDKKLVPDPKEAPIRKLMYNLFLERKRMRTVARLLNEAGHRTRNGSPFTGNTVERLIRDPIAKGTRRANYTKSLGEGKRWVVKPESEWVFIEVEPIVSEEIWSRCNQIFEEQHKTRPAARPVVNLFSGMVFCHCGKVMYVPSNSPKYTCRKCRNKIGVADLEELFHSQLKSFLFSEEEITGYLSKADQLIREKQELLENITREADSIKQEMNQLVRMCLSKEMPEEGFGRHYKPLEEQLKQIEIRLPELHGEVDFLKIQYLSSDEILAEAKDLHARWPGLTPAEKRNIVETITDKIIIEKDEVTIRLNYLPSLGAGNGGNFATQPHRPRARVFSPSYCVELRMSATPARLPNVPLACRKPPSNAEKPLVFVPAPTPNPSPTALSPFPSPPAVSMSVS
jgi:site-specific DNA recombinase